MSRHCRPRRELSKAERTNYYKALLVWGCFTLGGWLSIPSEYLPLFSHCIGFGFFLVLITGKTRWLIALSVGALIFSMLIYHTIPRSSIVLLSHSIGYIGMIALMIVVVFCTAVRPKLNNNDSNNNNNSSSNNNNSNVSNNNNDNNNKELDNDNNNDNDKSALFDRLNDRAFITQQFFDDIAKSMQILQLSMIDTYHEMQTYLHSLAVNNQSTSPIPSSPLPPLTPPPPLLSPSINDDDIEEEIEEEEEKEENQSPHHHQHHNNNKSSKKAEKKKRAKAKKKKSNQIMVEEEEEINNNKCKKCAIDYEKLSREQLLMVVHDFHQKLEESKEEYLKLSVIYQKTLLDDEKKSLEKFDHRSVQTSPTLHPILPIIRSSSPLPSIIAPPLSNPPPIIDSNNRSSSTADLDRLTRELKEMMMIQMKMQSELQQVRKAEGLSLINSSSSLSTPHSHLIMNNNNSNNNNNNNASSTSTDYYSNHSLLYNGTGPEGLSSYHHHHHFDDPEPGMS